MGSRIGGQTFCKFKSGKWSRGRPERTLSHKKWEMLTVKLCKKIFKTKQSVIR